MNAVIYASRGGNTKKLAEAIAGAAGVAAHSVSEVKALNIIDLLFVGASIYAGKIDGGLRKFLQELTVSQVKKIAVFGSAAGGKSALAEVREILKDNGISVLDEAFQCRGAFLLANRGRPNAEDLARAEDFAKRLCAGALPQHLAGARRMTTERTAKSSRDRSR